MIVRSLTQPWLASGDQGGEREKHVFARRLIGNGYSLALLCATASCGGALAPQEMVDTVRRDSATIGSVTLTLLRRGSGPHVVLVPAGGRGADDYQHLAAALATAGFEAVSLNHRGVDGSTRPVANLTLHDYAADIAGVIEYVGGSPAHVVGHAVGQRMARTLSRDRPELVRSLTVLAAGGFVPAAPEVTGALGRVINPQASDADRLADLRIAFFAPGNDASVWLTGWWFDAARSHFAAAALTPLEEWRVPPPQIPLLVVQGLNDATAVPENGRAFVAEHPNSRLVEISGAGHALLPEQPEAIAGAIVRFVREVEDGRFVP
jgi:pimeloyl-ACP methyl ester carboxylesterase